MSLLLGTWASAVFVVLWAGAVIGAMGDATLLAEAWAWLGSLDPVAAVVVWVLFLPVCIGLWAAQAGLPVAALIAVLVLLVGWTAVAWVSLARTLVARPSA